jgi:hypothetical protein
LEIKRLKDDEMESKYKKKWCLNAHRGVYFSDLS